MTTCLVAFIVAFLVSMVATVIVRHLGLKLSIVDKPDKFRKLHGRVIPRVGGIAIFAAFIAPLVALHWVYQTAVTDTLHENWEPLLWLVGGAGVSCGMGLWDDICNIRARWKLLFQVVAATIAYEAGFRIGAITIPFAGAIDFGVLSYPITVFWFVGCMNAVNLLDGLDGLAAGICLFATVTLLLVSLWHPRGLIFTILLMSCLSGAILGFLMFNFHPASIFLGDCGSMLLGFLVGALALHGSRKAEATVAILIPVITLGLPIFDTTLAVIRRWSRKLPLSAGDRQHVHHVLLAMGLSHRKVVLILYLACITLCGAAFLITMERSEVTLFVLGSLGIISFVCVRVFGGLNFVDLWGRLTHDLQQRQKSNEAKIAVEKAIVYMASADSAAEVWECFTDVVTCLDMDFASIKFYDEAGHFPPFMSWINHRDEDKLEHHDPDHDVWSARLRIHDGEKVFAVLEVGKRVEDGHMLPETPELLGKLRIEMSVHIRRLALEPEPASKSELEPKPV